MRGGGRAGGRAWVLGLGQRRLGLSGKEAKSPSRARSREWPVPWKPRLSGGGGGFRKKESLLVCCPRRRGPDGAGSASEPGSRPPLFCCAPSFWARAVVRPLGNCRRWHCVRCLFGCGPRRTRPLHMAEMLGGSGFCGASPSSSMSALACGAHHCPGLGIFSLVFPVPRARALASSCRCWPACCRPSRRPQRVMEEQGAPGDPVGHVGLFSVHPRRNATGSRRSCSLP